MISKRHAAATVLAAALGVLGMASAGLAADPPGQGPCKPVDSGKKCNPDPQPQHGAECEEHGPHEGGVNKHHCVGSTPPTTTVDTTTSASDTPGSGTTTTATATTTEAANATAETTPELTPEVTPEVTTTSDTPMSVTTTAGTATGSTTAAVVASPTRETTAEVTTGAFVPSNPDPAQQPAADRPAQSAQPAEAGPVSRNPSEQQTIVTPQTTEPTNVTSKVAATVTRRCVVPKLGGLTLQRARTAIARASCTVGRVTTTRSRLARGKVVAPRRVPGTQLRAGARIDLIVSRGSR